MLFLRRWAKTAALAATSYVGDSPLFVFGYLLRAFRVAVLLAIWRSIMAASPEASPLPLHVLLTYALIAEVFASQLSVRTTLAEALWQGGIATSFLRPMGLVAQFAAETSGRWAIDFALFSLPLLLVAPWLGVDPAPVSPTAGALFALSLLLSIAVGLAIDFLSSALTIALEQSVWLIEYVRGALVGLLSGAVIPLVLWPWGMGDVLAWLPFAAMGWSPLAIYTGAGDPARLLAGQLAWALALWPLVLWVWSRNRERVVAYGG